MAGIGNNNNLTFRSYANTKAGKDYVQFIIYQVISALIHANLVLFLGVIGNPGLVKAILLVTIEIGHLLPMS